MDAEIIKLKSLLSKLNDAVLAEAESRMTKAEDLLKVDNVRASQDGTVCKLLVSLSTIITKFNKSIV